jgi:hypothetical protein
MDEQVKGQSELAPLTALVGRSIHKDGLDDSPLYLTLTNIQP